MSDQQTYRFDLSAAERTALVKLFCGTYAGQQVVPRAQDKEEKRRRLRIRRELRITDVDHVRSPDGSGGTVVAIGRFDEKRDRFLPLKPDGRGGRRVFALNKDQCAYLLKMLDRPLPADIEEALTDVEERIESAIGRDGYTPPEGIPNAGEDEQFVEEPKQAT